MTVRAPHKAPRAAAAQIFAAVRRVDHVREDRSARSLVRQLSAPRSEALRRVVQMPLHSARAEEKPDTDVRIR